MANPAELGEFRVFNQFTEQFSVLELAKIVQSAGRARGLDVGIEHHVNPRVEAEHHYYKAVNDQLLGLGLEPHHLGEELVHSVLGVISRYADRVITRAIEPSVRWRVEETGAELRDGVSLDAV